MTNTMNTPVEALEITYPLRVERYELREGSGGRGRTAAATASSGHCTSSTTKRASRCSRIGAGLRPMDCTAAMTARRARNWVRDGTAGAELPGKVSLTLHAGETVGVETPGGGGWGGEGGG